MHGQTRVRAFALAFAFLALTSPAAWGQHSNLKRTAAGPFDIRDYLAETNGGAVPPIVQARRAGIESFLNSERTQRPGVRIVLNRRGLPRLYRRDGGTISGPSTGRPEEVAKDFLRSHQSIFSLSAADLDDLRLAVQDATPSGTFLVFTQNLHGVDVFEGQIKVTMDRAGEIVQTSVGEVMPGLTLSTTPRLTPEAALQAAQFSAGERNRRSFELLSKSGQKASYRNPFGPGYHALTAELCIFALDASTARLGYRVFLETGPESWYEMVIDADSGGLLYRHNLYVSAAHGRVWTDSPVQGSRELVTFPDSWLPAGSTVTTGNNADVYVDSDGNDHPDSLNTGDIQNGRASSAAQVFDFPFGDGLSGQDPRLSKAAAITNLFYFLNTAHDYYYSLGFTEAAGAFQTDKFGKGGIDGDAVLGEAQFGGFTNNALFAPTPQGVAPRIRMGLFTRGTSNHADDLDSDYEGEIIVHEYGHGVSNRLVGAGTSTSCLARIQSGALGEGWSDYFATSFFNNPVMGAYITQNTTAGVRRQSYEGYSFTYEDVGNAGYEVHNDGEIWAATLWDLRKSLGQRVTDQLVLSGLKSTPCNPSMTEARDAILSADQAANAGANRALLWRVFARHGLGYSAVGVDGSLLTGTRYDAASDLPPDLQPLANPAVTSNPLPLIASLGSLYSYTITASNPNGGTLSYALGQGPPGMTVDASSGAINWTAGFTGQRVKVVISDGKGGRVAHGYLLPVLTKISSNTPVVIEGGTGTAGFAFLMVPSGVPVLQMTLREGTGDADLFVVDPAGKVQFSARDGDNETLSFANPENGVWFVEVAGYAAFAGVKLAGTFVTPAELGVNSSVPGLSGVAGSEWLYRVRMPAGATGFSVSAKGGTGDVDLYIKKGSPALCQEAFEVSTPCIADHASEQPGNDELITVGNPGATDWYIDLSGYEDYSGVTLAVATSIPATLVIAPGPLSFTAVQGGPAPRSQSLSISNPSGSSYNWTAQANTASNGNWLHLAQSSGTDDGTLAVSADPAGLAPGSYHGTVTITAAGLAGSPQTLSVTLTVTGPPVLTVTPASLKFDAAAGQNSASQELRITNGGGGTLNWTATASPSWIQITPAAGTGDGSLQVSISGAELAPGAYSGTIAVSASGVSGPPVTVPISLTLTANISLPAISTGGVFGAASSSPPLNKISPGAFATVKGANFGAEGTNHPVQSSEMVNGGPPTQLAGVCVDVDGLPAYLTYVSSTQINFIVPAVRTGVTVGVRVRSNCGQADEVQSTAVMVQSETATPEFLYWAHPDDGQNPVIAINAATGAYVGPTSLLPVLSPAHPGDVLTIYGVSFGPTTPSYAPGVPPSGTGKLSDSVSIQLGGTSLSPEDVLYAGVSPGTAGLYQLNIHLPSGLAAGNYSLVLAFGAYSTPAGYLLVGP